MSPTAVEQDRPLAAKVEALAGFGLTAAEIATVLDVDHKTLSGNYAHELESGGIKANARVAESLYRQATGEGRQAVTAAIFWLKTRARWKETSVHEHAGVRDKPVHVDFSAWTDEMLEDVIRELRPLVEEAKPDRS